MKRTLKIFGISILAIFFLGVAVLAIHLIDITGKKSSPKGKNLQLCSFNFVSPVNLPPSSYAWCDNLAIICATEDGLLTEITYKVGALLETLREPIGQR